MWPKNATIAGDVEWGWRSLAVLNLCKTHYLQCFDTVGWAAGRASSL